MSEKIWQLSVYYGAHSPLAKLLRGRLAMTAVMLGKNKYKLDLLIILVPHTDGK